MGGQPETKQSSIPKRRPRIQWADTQSKPLVEVHRREDSGIPEQLHGYTTRDIELVKKRLPKKTPVEYQQALLVQSQQHFHAFKQQAADHIHGSGKSANRRRIAYAQKQFERLNFTIDSTLSKMGARRSILADILLVSENAFDRLMGNKPKRSPNHRRSLATHRVPKEVLALRRKRLLNGQSILWNTHARHAAPGATTRCAQHKEPHTPAKTTRSNGVWL